MTTTAVGQSFAGRRLLLIAAAASFLVAALHVVIPVAGPSWYRYFGAPSLAAEVERGAAFRPAAMTLTFAAIFALWGLYAAAGAGYGRRPPLLRAGLLTIGVVYALRGLFFIPQTLGLLAGRSGPSHLLLFSVVSLAIGVCYLVGTAYAWSALRKPGGPTA
jgi:hypothetical protein